MKKKLTEILYRNLRADMVRRMHDQSFTWTKMNTVLSAMGQKRIIRVERTAKGIKIFFAK